MRRLIAAPNWWAAKRWLDESLPRYVVLDLVPIRPVPHSENWVFEARLARR